MIPDMKINSKIYKYLLWVSVALAVGCSEDLLIDDIGTVGNPDVISFSAVVGAVDDGTRADGKELFEPLELSDGSDATLYLHTYESETIGLQPGESVGEDSPSTRGNQVGSVKDLIDFNEDFKVHAMYKADNVEYIEWAEAGPVSDGSDIWRTRDTRYWPGQNVLAFHAVSPSSEFSSLSNLSIEPNMFAFDYDAKKGATDADAVAQPDLMMAIGACNKEGSEEGKAPLHFNHALSAVKFAIRDVMGGEILNIKIAGVYGSGSCLYEGNDEGKGAFSWSVHKNVQTFSQNFNYKFDDRIVDPDDESQDIVMNGTMPEKTFMMIPQQIPADAEIIVKVKYNHSNDTKTLRGKIVANNVKEWKPGHEYIYTISTSKDNWVYVFDAVGNDAKGKENIYVYNPGADEFGVLGNNAYFSVRSYRYRANNRNYVERLPWSANHKGSYSYKVDGSNDVKYPEGNPQQKFVEGEKWITDVNTSSPLRGIGSLPSETMERHDLKFLPHYISTTWKGDELMQGYEPYKGFTKENPYDLSTFGDKENRTTANCYIVDRGGWYMLPLVYGNAVKNGEEISSPYTSQSASTDQDFRLLKKMLDYNDKPIVSSYIKDINENCKAELVWQDALNMLDSVEFVKIQNEFMIRFYVNSNSIQQGNAIVALTDGSSVEGKSKIIWSWHIWSTEHWLDPDTGKPNCYQNSAAFNFQANPVTGFRERGDVKVTHNQGSRTFYMAPYNLGWCDPKSVLYLKRKEDMNFVQYMPDGEICTGKVDVLPIIQDGEIVDYRYANNTYYQWGRKDPIRGFCDHKSAKKTVFGSRPSAIADQTVSIGSAIQNPNVFYGNSGKVYTENEDWLKYNGHANLWNNNENIGIDNFVDYRADASGTSATSFWCHTKTVYDPCPAGYMVPNAGIWHVLKKGTSGGWGSGSYKSTTALYDAMNGIMMSNTIDGQIVYDNYNYIIWGDGIVNNYDNAIFFSATGNKWWSKDHLPEVSGGDNFNGQEIYAWSSRYMKDHQFQNNGGFTRGAYGMALGLDTQDEKLEQGKPANYTLICQFSGRRAIGRAVRPIRE